MLGVQWPSLEHVCAAHDRCAPLFVAQWPVTLLPGVRDASADCIVTSRR